MARIPLTGGFYVAKNIIANNQRCINLYPEVNPQASEPAAQVTLLLAPGTDLIQSTSEPGIVRGLYRASNGTLYKVTGENVYRVNQDMGELLLGTIGVGTNQVYMADNGTAVLLVDGTANGYLLNMSTNGFSTISDPNFFGADRVDYLSQFFILNKPGTNIYYCNYPPSVAGSLASPAWTLNGLGNLGVKAIWPDAISGAVVMHGEIWLIGELKTEVWQNTGGANFPFTIAQGVYIEHGCIAKYSIAHQDTSIYWLSQDLQGNIIVLKGFPYGAERISTSAIESEFASYPTVNDAIGFTYQQEGHIFYVITFPTMDRTWVYDAEMELWHERVTTDVNGNFHRVRANCYANAYRQHIIGDFENGNLYSWDLQTYTDYIDGLGPNSDGTYPISRIRSFPHLVNDSDRVVYKSFTADMDVGNDTGEDDGSDQDNPPMVSLRWSDTKGKSWGNRLQQSLGAAGEYLTSIQWNRLGLARDRVFELSWSARCKTALQGAWIEVEKSET